MSNGSTAEAVFDALGEPTRRRIVEVLREGPAPVAELAGRLPVGRPAVSRHLRTLTDAGLVQHVTRGTRHLYSLAPEGLVVAQQWLMRTWDVVLGAYAVEVTRVTAASGPVAGSGSPVVAAQKSVAVDTASGGPSGPRPTPRPRPGLPQP